jgi:hypothetical protein
MSKIMFLLILAMFVAICVCFFFIFPSCKQSILFLMKNNHSSFGKKSWLQFVFLCNLYAHAEDAKLSEK